MRNQPITVALFLITIGALAVRLYGLNWDNGFHLHPDERAIVMISERIHWPKVGEWSKILTAESPLNPKFFAYGSLPLYLLKLTGFIGGLFDKSLAAYDKINILGRIISSLFDAGTVLLIYLLAQKLRPNHRLLALLAAFIYGTAVLPIQLSHFYAVDTILNFFITLDLLLLPIYLGNPSVTRIVAIGAVTGLAFATKFTAIFLLIPIILALIIAPLKGFRPTDKTSPFKQIINHLAFSTLHFSLFTLCSLLFAFLLMPYALIDFTTFKNSLVEQLRMSTDPYVFPFTLQYVGTKAYLYPLQQIFLWGLGPVTAILATLGFLILIATKASIMVYTIILKRRIRFHLTATVLIVGAFYLIYFLVVGRSAVKFMRYYLPLYPALSLLAAYFIDTVLTMVKQRLSPNLTRITLATVMTVTLIWPLAFIQIYRQPNTRLSASRWLQENISANSVLAEEAWDDGLPIGIPVSFQVLELPTIEFETTPDKWKKMEQTLSQADYLILASNRNYRPIQRLTDCRVIPVERCYTKTSEFYKQLFAGKLNYQKAAEFTVSPHLPFLNLPIDDQNADESFTVYDHPKVMIFKKS